jgi:hypothetical protein
MRNLPYTSTRRWTVRFTQLVLAGAAGLFAASSWASNVVPPPPPPQHQDDCSGSSSDPKGCPSTTNNGVTQTTLTTTSLGLLGTLGGAAGSFGNNLNGGIGSGPGVSRFALGTPGDTGIAAAGAGSMWNAWLAVARADVAYNFQPLQSGGHVDILLGGVDYTFKNNVILGVAVSGERTRIGNSYNGGNLRGSGNTIAPYLAWAINRSWVLDASIGYGRTTLDSTDNSVAGGITGSTRDKRSLGSLGLSYNHMMGKWQITGKGVLLTAEDRLASYTLSNGTFVPSTSSRTTQLRLGAQAAYNAGNGFLPWAGLTYIHDLDRPNQGPVGGQSAANDRDGVLVQLGLNFQSKGAFYGGITLSTEQARRQVKNDQVLVNVGMRF